MVDGFYCMVLYTMVPKTYASRAACLGCVAFALSCYALDLEELLLMTIMSCITTEAYM